MIAQGPRRDFRLPGGRWLAVAIAFCLAAATAVAVVLSYSGGSHPVSAPRPSPTAAPGTVLLGCQSAANHFLSPVSWTGSLKVGPLWFVDSRQSGYVHSGAPSGRLIHPGGPARRVAMIVGVEPGSVVVIKPATTARRPFRFLQVIRPAGHIGLPAGDNGFTLAACPPGDIQTNNHLPEVSDFDLGFFIQPGVQTVVNIWPSASSRPIRVTLTCPAASCGEENPAGRRP